jgi:SWI/SNF-related matrix-associated actin-dependent regulator 1 of chromatin subfamily A
MKIHVAYTDTERPVFWADSEKEERHALKDAGWWWHPQVGQCFSAKGGKPCSACDVGLKFHWWTPFPEKAARFVDYADDDTKAALADTVAALDASRAADSDADIPAPDGLEYMPFQRAGIAYALKHENVLLADEMGLGKTPESLGIINADPSIQRVLVICPASLRLNWRNEANRWLLPRRGFTVQVLTKPKDAPDMLGASPSITIMSYEGATRTFDALMAADEFDLIIVDEAHMAKNPKSLRAKRILGYWDKKNKCKVEGLISRCRRRAFLTGTPILNRPIELHPLVAALDPQHFGNFFRFAKRYCNGHQKQIPVPRSKKYPTGRRNVWDFTGASHLDELNDLLRANVMVRRLKDEVLTELPPKLRTVIEIPANGAKRVVKAERKAFGDERMEQLNTIEADLQAAIDAGDDMAYAQLAQQLDNSLSVAFEAMSDFRHKVALEKLPHVIEYVNNMLESGIEKILVFCWHRDIALALQEEWGDAAVHLIGGTSTEHAELRKARFQTDPSCKIFIGNIKAAGVGHTLTAAHHVVFAELDWVPGNVTQAEDRAHRHGQQHTVNVHHLVFEDSLDARMVRFIAAKQRVARAALDTSTKMDVENHPAVQEAREATAAHQQRRKRAGLPPQDRAPTAAEREAVTQAIQTVASMCDGAREEDGCGFNKLDTGFGKDLARKSLQTPLSDGQIWAGARMVRKYKRQFGDGLAEVIDAMLARGRQTAAQDEKEENTAQHPRPATNGRQTGAQGARAGNPVPTRETQRRLKHLEGKIAMIRRSLDAMRQGHPGRQPVEDRLWAYENELAELKGESGPSAAAGMRIGLEVD